MSRREDETVAVIRDRVLEALHPMLGTAFRAFDRAGISWCLLRFPTNPAAPTGDVDLLVGREDWGRAGRVLRGLGFAWLPVLSPAYGREPEAFYLACHPGTDHYIYLHVVTELSFGPGHNLRVHHGATDECLSRSRRRGALVSPDPEDAFWVLLLHCLLDKGVVEPRHRTSLQALAEAAKDSRTSLGQLARATEAACTRLPSGGSWRAAEMLEWARRGLPENWAALERLAPDLALAWPLWRKRTKSRALLDRGLWLVVRLLGLVWYRDYRRYARRTGRELLRNTFHRCRRGHMTGIVVSCLELRRKVIRSAIGASPVLERTLSILRALPRSSRGSRTARKSRRGLTVALLGPDGAGKSTLAANLEGSLSGFWAVRTLYMGLGYAGLPRLARLPVPGLRAAVGLLTLWWRSLVARHHKGRGRMVVFDRYTHDALLPPQRHLSRPQRLARWVWAHSCPAPDMTLLLDVPAEAVQKRIGGGGEREQLEAARRDFLSLEQRIPGLQVVDASRPEKYVLRDAAQRIRRHYVACKGGRSA